MTVLCCSATESLHSGTLTSNNPLSKNRRNKKILDSHKNWDEPEIIFQKGRTDWWDWSWKQKNSWDEKQRVFKRNVSMSGTDDEKWATTTSISTWIKSCCWEMMKRDLLPFQERLIRSDSFFAPTTSPHNFFPPLNQPVPFFPSFFPTSSHLHTHMCSFNERSSSTKSWVSPLFYRFHPLITSFHFQKYKFISFSSLKSQTSWIRTKSYTWKS